MTEIVLTEYQTQTFPKTAVLGENAALIREQYGAQLDIGLDWQHDQWTLKPKGYIGLIPVAPNLSIRLQPKTAIKYIWQMLDYVENLNSFRFFQTLQDCDAIEDSCDHLARLLAQKIFHRSKQGLYQAYLPESDRLTVPRGRIQWHRAARRPWDTRLPCHYDRQTMDLPENQILLWTLHQLGRSPDLFTPKTRQQLRIAHRTLKNSVRLVPFMASDTEQFIYHRLNEDYKTLHQLCYFFLANLAPSLHHGNNQAIPFLLNTAALYEKFVYGWLKKHLPKQFELKAQETYKFNDKINYHLDLVLYEKATKKAIAVLDTKYKTPTKPSNDDLNQIITYATLKDCPQGILIYPQNLTHPIQETLPQIQIRSLTFPVDQDCHQAGQKFLRQLLP